MGEQVNNELLPSELKIEVAGVKGGVESDSEAEDEES
jgi:hypothetical protein